MATIRKIRQGHLAKRNGQLFENAIINQARYQRWHIMQIPMGAKMIGKLKMIRVKTPFDFVMFKKKNCISFDAKSTSAKTFNASKITPHQLYNLKKIQDEGFHAGYVVYFSELKKVVYFSAQQLLKTKKRSSLKSEDGIQLGSVMDINFSKITETLHSSDSAASHNTRDNSRCTSHISTEIDPI